MPTSDARIAANRANALKSIGPRTEEGKERSKRNAYKHGLAGTGAVVPDAEMGMLDERFSVLMADLKPKTAAGVVQVQAMAVYAVRMDRAMRHETDALAYRVRHAVEEFDEARHVEADSLFESLATNPRTSLRRLKKSPEGVDRLIDGWGDLRATLMGPNGWTADHLARAASLSGARVEEFESTRLGLLWRATRGDFEALADRDGGGLDDQGRREWARDRIGDRIDAEVDALEAHFETLDFETIALDRPEAPGRALFDPSKEAILARRYEAAAARGYHKAMEEFRRVEAEAAARAESAPVRPSAPPRRAEPALASNRQPAPTPTPEPSSAPRMVPMSDVSQVLGRDGQPLAIGRPPESRR